EGIGASLWWPNKDHLSDEPDSMSVTCTIPADLTFVGNGTLEADVLLAENKRSMTWKVHYPINNYNISLNIGKYVNFQDSYIAQDGEKLLLDYWVMPYNLEKAKVQFKQVQPMLGCYETYFGKFPFWKDNYKLVETPYLGMEHQTAIAYGNDYKKGYAGFDFSRIGLDFDYIIIHESGHEYWGNLISCKDAADLWIHESFCTYSEALYVECMFDYNKGQEYVNAKKATVDNLMPIAGVYGVNAEGDGDMYNKGMLFLNTLRHVVNKDELWFAILKEMTSKEFAYKTIDAKDLISFFKERTKLNLDPIFEQYLYSNKLPKLYYHVEKLKGKEYAIHYKWLTDAEGFEMPLELEVGTTTIRLEGNNTLQTFTFNKKKKEALNLNDTKFYIDLKEY
ncbi:MAG: M1 family peptidase, partial [Bacteroidetes bacterium]|nr:M1 family peptidase [Bacteroidota bacterium]